MRQISLNARRAHDEQHSPEVEVLLFVFEHPTLNAPIRFSTDPTERISTDPLVYGTRSSWMDANPETDPYLFIMASASLPSDTEDGAAPAQIVLDNLDRGIAQTLRSITNRATVHLAVVLASSPDVIETEIRDLRLIEVQGDASHISLTISREPIEEEQFPTARFTKDRFPACFL